MSQWIGGRSQWSKRAGRITAAITRYLSAMPTRYARILRWGIGLRACCHRTLLSTMAAAQRLASVAALGFLLLRRFSPYNIAVALRRGPRQSRFWRLAAPYHGGPCSVRISR